MKRRQRKDHLEKICACRKWASCEHPWHFSYKAVDKPRVRVSLDGYAGRSVRGIEHARRSPDSYAPRLMRVRTLDSSPQPAEVVTYEMAAKRFLRGVPILRARTRARLAETTTLRWLASCAPGRLRPPGVLRACNKTSIGSPRVVASASSTKHYATRQALSGSRDGDSQYLPWRNPSCHPTRAESRPCPSPRPA